MQIGSPKILFFGGGGHCVCVHIQLCVSTDRCVISDSLPQLLPHFIYCDRIIGPGLCQFQFIS